jgi:hypothetical protein
MNRTDLFSDDERELVAKIVGAYKVPPPLPPERWGEPVAPRRLPSTEQLIKLVRRRYGRLETMQERRKLLAAARKALDLAQLRRNLQRAKGFLVVYMKLLHLFGHVGGEFAQAAEQVIATTSGDESKNTQIFECLTMLPFGIVRPMRGANESASALERELYGLAAVKREVKHELIMQSHAKGAPVPTPLLLVGPPGTGKTSVAMAIAAALGLPFVKIGLAGTCDTIYLRGSHYSWNSATPGQLVKALMGAGCANPVVLLDEIDKAGGYAQGNVIDTLAEVLDVTQSATFHDQFVGVPVDLSQVVWIATANSLEAIPDYIVNRCKMIKVAAYTQAERKVIVRDYLPAQIAAQRKFAFPIAVEDELAERIAEEIESLREAKLALLDLVARELEGRKPGMVRNVVLSRWEHELSARPGHRPIGFQPPERERQRGLEASS